MPEEVHGPLLASSRATATARRHRSRDAEPEGGRVRRDARGARLARGANRDGVSGRRLRRAGSRVRGRPRSRRRSRGALAEARCDGRRRRRARVRRAARRLRRGRRAAARPSRPALIWQDRRAVEHVACARGARVRDHRAGRRCEPHGAEDRVAARGRACAARAITSRRRYLVERLTGAAVIDPAHASTTMLFDLLARHVVARAARRVRDRRRASCRRCAGTARSPARSRAAGARAHRASPPGTPVAVGTGDDFATPLGAGHRRRPGRLVVRARHGRGRRRARRYAGVRFAARARRAIRGARCRADGRDARVSDRRRSSSRTRAGSRAAPCAGRRACSGCASDAELDALAATAPPGADGVTFVPALAGAMTPVWRPHARGTLHGLAAAHDRAHVARAVLEGLAFACRDVVERLVALGLPRATRRARRRRRRASVWTQIRADALGLPHHVAARTDTCAVGAAMIAAVAVGRRIPTCARRRAARHRRRGRSRPQGSPRRRLRALPPPRRDARAAADSPWASHRDRGYPPARVNPRYVMRARLGYSAAMRWLLLVRALAGCPSRASAGVHRPSIPRCAPRLRADVRQRLHEHASQRRLRLDAVARVTRRAAARAACRSRPQAVAYAAAHARGPREAGRSGVQRDDRAHDSPGDGLPDAAGRSAQSSPERCALIQWVQAGSACREVDHARDLWSLAIVAARACGDDEVHRSRSCRIPRPCKECHPKHYEQWSGSMHAYASDDPVFVAMNKRGQRETNGELGDFCVKCHAPMAVALGIADRQRLRSRDAAARRRRASPATSATTSRRSTDDHNNGLVLAMDQTMRGGVKNPVDTPAHHSKYDPLMDARHQQLGDVRRRATTSSRRRGVHIERTFAEWKTTIFASRRSADVHLTCSSCHMIADRRASIADEPGLDVQVARRRVPRAHVARDRSGADAVPRDRRAGARRSSAILDPAIAIVGPRRSARTMRRGGICLDPPDGSSRVRIDSLGVGHMFPSGAAQDRRVWLEVIAYDADNNVVFQSGVVPDGMDPEEIDDRRTARRRRTVRASGIARTRPTTRRRTSSGRSRAYDSKLLKAADHARPELPAFDHSTTVDATTSADATTQIDRIEARMLRSAPLPFARARRARSRRGDLDPSVRDAADDARSDDAATTSTWLTVDEGHRRRDQHELQPVLASARDAERDRRPCRCRSPPSRGSSSPTRPASTGSPASACTDRASAIGVTCTVIGEPCWCVGHERRDRERRAVERAPTTPLAIVLIWTTHVLSPRAGGAGVADISLKSSMPLVAGLLEPDDERVGRRSPSCSRPVVIVRRCRRCRTRRRRGPERRRGASRRMRFLRIESTRLLPTYEPQGDASDRSPALTP